MALRSHAELAVIFARLLVALFAQRPHVVGVQAIFFAAACRLIAFAAKLPRAGIMAGIDCPVLILIQRPAMSGCAAFHFLVCPVAHYHPLSHMDPAKETTATT